MIIIDDCSTDGTDAIIREKIKNNTKTILVKTKKHIGSPGTPRDIGIQQARGKYIGLLDADDTYHPEKLAIHYNTLTNNPNIDIIHTTYAIVDINGAFIKYRKRPWFEYLYQRLFEIKLIVLLTNPFGTSTVIIKKKIIENYRFDLHPQLLAAVEDWYLWTRLLRDNILIIVYEPSPLTNYRWLENSISSRKTHRSELRSIVFFSILLSKRKISILEWTVAVFIRLLRIFCKKYFFYEKRF